MEKDIVMDGEVVGRVVGITIVLRGDMHTEMVWVDMSRKYGFKVTTYSPDGSAVELTTVDNEKIDRLRKYFDSGEELTVERAGELVAA